MGLYSFTVGEGDMRASRISKFFIAVLSVGGVTLGIASSATAAPVPGQFVPVGVYLNTQSAFGIAYDPVNDIIHYTQGDSGDALVHTLKAFKNYTAAEIAALPLINGIPALSLAVAEHDVAGTTNPGGFGGSGSGAHFSALAFNTATGQLVQTSSGDVRAYDPFTAANQTTIANVGSGFADGLDIDGANAWFSPDVQDIFKNGALFIDDSDPSKTVLPGWSGLGSETGLGWAGVEQVGDSLFAVAVHSGADTGNSRTIVRFDATTGELLGFDPDGNPVAARWEDLAFDGSFLYAADLRGNADGTGVIGDIYVFAVTGGLSPDPTPVPEPSSLWLFVIGASVLGLAAMGRGRRQTT